MGIQRRILISCFICFASVSIQSTPMTQLSPDGAPVLELQVQDQVLALTPEQVSVLIERATADDVQAQCVLGVAYARRTAVPHNGAEAVKWLSMCATCPTAGMNWSSSENLGKIAGPVPLFPARRV